MAFRIIGDMNRLEVFHEDYPLELPNDMAEEDKLAIRAEKRVMYETSFIVLDALRLEREEQRRFVGYFSSFIEKYIQPDNHLATQIEIVIQEEDAMAEVERLRRMLTPINGKRLDFGGLGI